MYQENNAAAAQTILLVDDEEEILDFLTDILGTKYTIITALNGKEALTHLENSFVQLVISDIMMPLMDGYELCQYIKSSANLSHIPVILLTAKTTLSAKIEGLEGGADAYIDKPFSTKYLLAHVASLLANRQKIQDFFSRSQFVEINAEPGNHHDELFLKKLNAIINVNLSDPGLDIDHLADKMNMGRSTFYRKIKSVSPVSANELINLCRLQKSAELLLKNDLRVYEIAHIVGFNSPSYFTQSFFKHFGVTPKEYVAHSAGQINGDKQLGTEDR